MKKGSTLLPSLNWRSSMRFGLLLVLYCCLTEPSGAFAQQETIPFDVFGESIDNVKVYQHIEDRAVEVVANQPDDFLERLKNELENANETSEFLLNELVHDSVSDENELYPHMMKASIYLGSLYNCGRCERTHAGFSGGVMVGQNGLALTNYHVLEQRKSKNQIEGFMAMTFDGKCFEIERVVAADERADVALVQLKSDGHKFYAAPIASDRPNPTETVRVISNPFGQFFVMTRGEVSRYSKRIHGRKTGDGHWLEITADFGGGSSGSPVFDSQGNVVGLVSRIHPLMRKSNAAMPDELGTRKNRSTYVEMILRRCVPLNEIHDCFR